MRCAVTGGAGFIGSHVVDVLKEAGHDVVVIDHRVRPHRSDVTYKDVDVVEFSAVLNACAGCDTVFHLAAVSNVNYAFEQPAYTVRLNVDGTANVLEAARHLKMKRVIFASTVWVYTGAREDRCDEDSPFYMPGAGHVYTSTKIASELLCHDYAKLYGQEFTILRYGIPYGPRMRDELLIPIFLKKALSGQPLTISGDGAQYRNFIYVEDLARAHLLCLGEKGKNETFNLEGARRISVKEVAETIQRLAGGDVKIIYTPARPGDYAGKEVSNARAERLLGWKPTVDFEEGMRRTLAWYRSR
ncbi:MAG: NAD-dependent epimerase/dehydratase family protein [Planctomycetes bacterium]|nr:NAD-dependent epimerase/dehydratase family protein [Planctomycetota bacterium]